MRISLHMPNGSIPRWPVRVVLMRPWRLGVESVNGFVESQGRHSRAWLFTPVDARSDLSSGFYRGDFWISHCGRFAIPCA